MSTTSELAALTKTVKSLEKEKEELQSLSGNKSKELEDYIQKHNDISEKLKALTDELKEKTKQFDDSKKKLTELEDDLTSTKKELETEKTQTSKFKTSRKGKTKKL